MILLTMNVEKLQ